MAKLAPAQGSSKNQAAADRARTAAIGAGEPIITLENYNVDLGNAFTYYSTYEDDKVRRKWVQKYLGKDKESITKLGEVPDYELKQIAVLIRLADRGQPLKPEHIAKINEKLNKALASVGVEQDSDLQPVKSTKQVVTVAQRIEAIANNHIADIEHELDGFVLNKKSGFVMKDYVASNAISAPAAKIIAKWFNNTLTELNEAIDGSDEQLVEAYSHFTASNLKKFRNMVQNIIDECVQQKMKVARKTRKVKVKPASEVVKRIKYLPEFTDETLTLKSLNPIQLINSNQALIYNTKTRKITRFIAADNDILVVKGSSILNFDTIKSETRTLRKPVDFFTNKFTKVSLASMWKTLTTKSIIPNGRINADCIIVAIF